MEALNVAGALLIFYFAFVSLFHREELLGTRLGKTTMGLVVLIYLSRAAEEFFLFKFQPLIFVACLVVGLLYLAPLDHTSAYGDRREGSCRKCVMKAEGRR